PLGGPSYNLGNPVSGRQNNQGFEGLAMSPDRKTLFVLLQSAAIQDLDATSSATIRHTRKNTRLLAYDLGGREPTLVGEYAVQLPQIPDPASTGQTLTAAQSELHALNDTQFLVLARDSGRGSPPRPRHRPIAASTSSTFPGDQPRRDQVRLAGEPDCAQGRARPLDHPGALSEISRHQRQHPAQPLQPSQW